MAEGLDLFRPGPVATGGMVITSGSLSFATRTLVEWISANSTQTR